MGISSAGSTWRKRGHAIQFGYQLDTDLGSWGSNMSKVCPRPEWRQILHTSLGVASNEAQGTGVVSPRAGGRIFTRGYVEWALSEWTNGNANRREFKLGQRRT